jgi:hypothetical protein
MFGLEGLQPWLVDKAEMPVDSRATLELAVRVREGVRGTR